MRHMAPVHGCDVTLNLRHMAPVQPGRNCAFGPDSTNNGEIKRRYLPQANNGVLFRCYLLNNGEMYSPFSISAKMKAT